MISNAKTNIELILERTKNIDIPHKISTGEHEFIRILCAELGKEDMIFDRISYRTIDFYPKYNNCEKNIFIVRKGGNQTIIGDYNFSDKQIIINIPFVFFFAHIRKKLEGSNKNVLYSVIHTNFEILNTKKNKITASYFNTELDQRYNFNIFKRFFKNEWYIKDSAGNKYNFNKIENTYTNNLIENYNFNQEQKKDRVINMFFD